MVIHCAQRSVSRNAIKQENHSQCIFYSRPTNIPNREYWPNDEIFVFICLILILQSTLRHFNTSVKKMLAKVGPY